VSTGGSLLSFGGERNRSHPLGRRAVCRFYRLTDQARNARRDHALNAGVGVFGGRAAGRLPRAGRDAGDEGGDQRSRGRNGGPLPGGRAVTDRGPETAGQAGGPGAFCPRYPLCPLLHPLKEMVGAQRFRSLRRALSPPTESWGERARRRPWRKGGLSPHDAARASGTDSLFPVTPACGPTSRGATIGGTGKSRA
jgi:hypothetical protein